MQKAVAAWFLLIVSAASLASPTEVVQLAVEQVVRLMQDSERPAASEQRRFEIRLIANRLFDFTEMARRSLGRHWSDRTSQQREEFVRLFSGLLERSYFSKIENYAGERFVYNGETVEGEFATVRSKIIGGRKAEIPVDYRLHLAGSRWAVHDVLIDGISIVSNYRAQFNQIIQTSSYDNLIQKMRLKELETARGQGSRHRLEP